MAVLHADLLSTFRIRPMSSSFSPVCPCLYFMHAVFALPLFLLRSPGQGPFNNTLFNRFVFSSHDVTESTSHFSHLLINFC